MSTAFVDALKKMYPQSEIDVVVKTELAPLLDYCKDVGEVYKFSKKEFSGWRGACRFGKFLRRKKEYDLFFCLPNSFSSAWMGCCTRIKTRIGYKNEFRNFLFTHSYKKKKGLHRVEEYVDLLNEFTGVSSPSFSVKLSKPSKTAVILPQGKNVLLNINSEADSRRMPLELAKKIIVGIQKKYGCNILLTGSKKEIAYVGELENQLNSREKIYNYAGKTDLKELVELVSRVDGVVSTDSGIAHLSNAFSIPTIVLFGAGDEKNTRPYNPKDLKIIRKIGLECAPCISNTCKYGHLKCLRELESGEIVEEVGRLLEKS